MGPRDDEREDELREDEVTSGDRLDDRVQEELPGDVTSPLPREEGEHAVADDLLPPQGAPNAGAGE